VPDAGPQGSDLGFGWEIRVWRGNFLIRLWGIDPIQI
jgi:hypothetical protein